MRRYPYPGLHEILAPEIAELAPEQIDSLLTGLTGGSAEHLESFWQSVSQVAKQVGGGLQKALPGMVQGATTGMALGPWGALAGAVAGGALSAAGGGRGRPAGRAAGISTPSAGAAPPGLAALAGSPAAAQLLQVITRPETLQALLGMALGKAGQRQVPVGDKPVPVAAFANLVDALAQEAMAQYHETVAGDAAGTPLYLLDDAGELTVDPADPVQRAEALLRRLSEASLGDRSAEPAESEEDWEADEQWEIEELDALWDEMELAALAADEEL